MIWFMAILFVVLFVAFVACVATRPDTFRVQRTTSIDAPPETIFPLISDFRQWESWSPYEQLDPGMKRTYSGERSGKGAVYEWAGNRKAGEGRMEIAHTSPFSAVVIRLDFVRPFESQNIVEFKLQPDGGSTKATWSMRGSNPWIAKLMQLFVSMDSMVGKDFERGLARLKSIAEGEVARAVPRYASTG